MLSRKIFPQNGRKLESVENIIRDIFIQVFNKTILIFNKTLIPRTRVGYELLDSGRGAATTVNYHYHQQQHDLSVDSGLSLYSCSSPTNYSIEYKFLR